MTIAWKLWIPLTVPFGFAALTARGVEVAILEQLPQVLPRTLDPDLASQVQQHLSDQGVHVHTETAVETVSKRGRRLHLETSNGPHVADLLLVVTGVRPNTSLAKHAGVRLGVRETIAVDQQMRTNVPGIWAAGDCVHTHHRLLNGTGYLPLGTTAHKQGRIAGENALGGHRQYEGSVGTQVVKAFRRLVAATGLRDADARQSGFEPLTVASIADDHKRYYPGATPIEIRLTGDVRTGRLLGAQLVGVYGTEISKRIDIIATAIHYGALVDDVGDLDLSYAPPLGAPWDALQSASQAWSQAASTTPGRR